MQQDIEALNQLARIAIEGPGTKETLARAALIIRQATGAAEAMVVYAEDADFLVCSDAENDPATDFTQTALWVVQRQIAELGGPVTFNLIGHRVEDFASASSDEERDFLALSMPTGEGASEMCILRGSPNHKSRATILRFIESATPSLTVILERFLNIGRTHRYGEKLSALANAAQLLTQSEDLQAALTDLATAIAGSTASDYVSIDVYDADSERFVLRVLSQSRFAGLPVTQAWIDSLDPDRPDPRNLEVTRSRQPYLSPDVQNDEREPESLRRYFQATLIRSMAAFPMLFQDEFLGTVAFVYYAPHAFPPEEISFLQGFVAQAATAFKALQMHNELQRSTYELKKSADEYIATTNLTGDIIARLDKHGNWTFLNDAACQFYGKSREELLGTNSTAFLHPDDLEPTAHIIRETRAKRAPEKGFVNRQLTPTGMRWVEWNGYPLFDEDGQYAGVQITGRDITRHKHMEEALRESEERYRLLAENTSDLIWTVDMGLRYTYMSPSIKHMRGYTPEEVVGSTVAEAMTPASLELARKTLAEELAIERTGQGNPHRSRKLELEMYCKDGSTIWTEMNMTFLRDAEHNPIGIQGVTRDITERKQMEQERERLHAELEVRAITDGLTGLYNHAHFYKRLAEEIDRSNRYGRGFAVLMMDIDSFKHYNDSRGHQAGDNALRLIADCIRKSIRRSDIAFRYGGDEFAAILLHADSRKAKATVNRMNRRIAARLKEVDDPAAAWLHLRAGVACFPDDATTADELVRVADTALYDAKRLAWARGVMGRDQTVDSPASPSQILEEKQMGVLSAAASSLAAALQDVSVPDVLADLDLHTIAAVGAAAETKDPYIRKHQERVSQWAALLAEKMELPPKRVQEIRIAGLLHDLGKITVGENILTKPGKLSEKEFAKIKEHPAVGAMVVAHIEGLQRLVEIIRHHHERFGGKGYPDGLTGEEIPLGARILSVVDAFDAMTHERSYRKALNHANAIAELKRCTGSQFDPAVVQAFLALAEEGGGDLSALPQAASKDSQLAAASAGEQRRGP